MDDKDMATNLWELANLVAGFSVAQSLATLFAVVRGDLDDMFDDRAHRISLIGIATSALLYVGLIVYCGCEGEHLDHTHWRIWLVSTIVRSIAVVVFAGIFGGVILRHWKLTRKSPIGSVPSGY